MATKSLWRLIYARLCAAIIDTVVFMGILVNSTSYMQFFRPFQGCDSAGLTKYCNTGTFGRIIFNVLVKTGGRDVLPDF